MSSQFSVQELAIAITAKDLNPAALNPDFFKYSNVIPKDWKLAKKPVYTSRLVQLLFQNGVGIIAEPNRIVFVEAIANKPIDTVEVAHIAIQCVEKLPGIGYQAVGINPRGHATFPDDEARQYIADTLLALGGWQDFGESPTKAAIQLSYVLEQVSLTVSVSDVSLRSQEGNAIDAVMFSGNFNYAISGEDSTKRLAALTRSISNWQSDLDRYQKLIEEKFLHKSSTLELASA